MFGTRSMFALLFAAGLFAAAAEAAAKDYTVPMAVKEVSGINSDCAVPYGFNLSYSADQKTLRMGKQTRVKGKHTRFTRKQSDGQVGRVVTTTFDHRNKSIEISETAVSLSSQGSCKFVFQGRLRS